LFPDPISGPDRLKNDKRRDLVFVLVDWYTMTLDPSMRKKPRVLPSHTDTKTTKDTLSPQYHQERNGLLQATQPNRQQARRTTNDTGATNGYSKISIRVTLAGNGRLAL
jgi:hypothetical protein